MKTSPNSPSASGNFHSGLNFSFKFSRLAESRLDVNDNVALAGCESRKLFFKAHNQLKRLYLHLYNNKNNKKYSQTNNLPERNNDARWFSCEFILKGQFTWIPQSNNNKNTVYPAAAQILSFVEVWRSNSITTCQNKFWCLKGNLSTLSEILNSVHNRREREKKSTLSGENFPWSEPQSLPSAAQIRKCRLLFVRRLLKCHPRPPAAVFFNVCADTWQVK